MNIPIDERWKHQPWHEIYQEDCYRLKRLRFTPNLILDIGGNLGCFAAYAKTIWPQSKVVTVEPHPTNFSTLMEAVGNVPGVVPVNAAMGTSPVHWVEAPGGDNNPGGHTYICESVGYTLDDLKSIPPASCPAISLHELFEQHKTNGPYVVKIDCEGGEECLFDDDASNGVLHDATYFAVELHFFAAKQRKIPDADKLKPGLLGTHGHVIREFFDWIYGFSDTHKVEVELLPNSGMLWATKR